MAGYARLGLTAYDVDAAIDAIEDDASCDPINGRGFPVEERPSGLSVAGTDTVLPAATVPSELIAVFPIAAFSLSSVAGSIGVARIDPLSAVVTLVAIVVTLSLGWLT